MVRIETEAYTVSDSWPANPGLLLSIFERIDPVSNEPSNVVQIKVRFDDTGFVHTAHADGPLVNSEKRLRFEQRVMNYTGDSIESVAALLRAQGAALVPGGSNGPTRVLTQTALNLTPFLGRFQIESVRFSMNAERDLPKAASSGPPAWRGSFQRLRSGVQVRVSPIGSPMNPSTACYWTLSARPNNSFGR